MWAGKAEPDKGRAPLPGCPLVRDGEPAGGAEEARPPHRRGLQEQRHREGRDAALELTVRPERARALPAHLYLLPMTR